MVPATIKLRIPKDVLDRIDQAARRTFLRRSEFVRKAVLEAVHREIGQPEPAHHGGANG